MTGGAGHILEMIARVKANHAKRKKGKLFKEDKDFIKIHGNREIKFKELTQAEMEENRRKTKAYILKEKRRSRVILIISLVLTVLITLALFFLLKPGQWIDKI
jgi:hypothetical protein